VTGAKCVTAASTSLSFGIGGICGPIYFRCQDKVKWWRHAPLLHDVGSAALGLAPMGGAMIEVEF
jgi:hypothetical protein